MHQPNRLALITWLTNVLIRLLMYSQWGWYNWAGCPVLLFFLFFPIFSKLPIYSYILSRSPIFLKNAENQPYKSCFLGNLQHLTMSFWGPTGPQTPAGMRTLIFVSRHSMLFAQRGHLRFFSLYIKGTKKLGICRIVLISLFQAKCTFFMVFRWY